MGFEYYMNVYAEDVDHGGIVYHANYLRYAERCRSEWLNYLGFSLKKCMEEYIYFVVKSANIEYIKPAFLSDTLAVDCVIKKMGKTSIQMKQSIWKTQSQDPRVKQERELLATIDLTLVHINQLFKPTAIPHPIIEAIKNDK